MLQVEPFRAERRSYDSFIKRKGVIMTNVTEMYDAFRSGKPMAPEEINYMISHMQEIVKLLTPLGHVFLPACNYASTCVDALTKRRDRQN